MQNNKIALCMPYKDDEDVLEWTLAKIPAVFNEYIFIDTGSTDKSTELIKRRFPKAIILEDHIDHIDFGKWRTMLIAEAEARGCTWCFMLDSDETLFTESYHNLLAYMRDGESEVYRLARIDFVGSKSHYRTDVFPDWQGRLFKLNQGYYFAPKVHAQLEKDGQVIQGQYLPHIVIYHYGWIRDPNKKKLHYLNAERTLQGLPMTDQLPEGAQLSQSAGKIPYTEWSIKKFIGKQP